MTPAQLAILKAAILADPALASLPLGSDGAFAIADAMQVIVIPSFFIWRDRGEVSLGDILGNGYDYARIDNLTVGRARIWADLQKALELGQMSANQANHRAGVNAAFNQGADSGMRLALFGMLQRPANRGEKLFAAGSGATTNDAGVGPGTAVVYGRLVLGDIEAARALP